MTPFEILMGFGNIYDIRGIRSNPSKVPESITKILRTVDF